MRRRRPDTRRSEAPAALAVGTALGSAAEHGARVSQLRTRGGPDGTDRSSRRVSGLLGRPALLPQLPVLQSGRAQRLSRAPGGAAGRQAVGQLLRLLQLRRYRTSGAAPGRRPARCTRPAVRRKAAAVSALRHAVALGLLGLALAGCQRGGAARAAAEGFLDQHYVHIDLEAAKQYCVGVARAKVEDEQ